MSIILDALRRGRGKPQAGPNPNAAQTDAVLQTLGYGRLNPATPLNRLKRMLTYLALAVVFGVMLWAAVIWLTRAYVSSVSSGATPVREVTRVPAPVATPTPPPPEISTGPAAPTQTTVSAREIPAHPSEPASPAPAPAVSPAPPAPERPAASDPSSRLLVQNSQRTGAPVSAPPAPPGSPAVARGDDHFARAMMYQRLGDFENALVSYRQVLQGDDLNVEAHNNLGVLYRDKGLFEDAVRHFQRAIAINPRYARARNNLGVVYLSQRKLEMSATQFHAALAIDSKNVESMINLSTVEKESGEQGEARRWLTRAMVIDPRNAEAHYNLALLEDESGNRAQALTHYRAFLRHGAASHPALVADVRKRIDALAAK